MAKKAKYVESRERMNMTSGQMIRTIRKLQLMSRRELADKMGTTRRLVRWMEEDRFVLFECSIVKDCAKALRVDPRVLLESCEAERGSSKETVAPIRIVEKLLLAYGALVEVLKRYPKCEEARQAIVALKGPIGS